MWERAAGGKMQGKADRDMEETTRRTTKVQADWWRFSIEPSVPWGAILLSFMVAWLAMGAALWYEIHGLRAQLTAIWGR